MSGTIQRQHEIPDLFDAFVRLSNQVFKSKKVHLKPEKAFCSRCSSQIVWVKLVNNRKHPVNWAIDAARGNLVYSGEAQAWRMLKGVDLENYRRRGELAATSHFDTCPFADEFRSEKSKKAR